MITPILRVGVLRNCAANSHPLVGLPRGHAMSVMTTSAPPASIARLELGSSSLTTMPTTSTSGIVASTCSDALLDEVAVLTDKQPDHAAGDCNGVARCVAHM